MRVAGEEAGSKQASPLRVAELAVVDGDSGLPVASARIDVAGKRVVTGADGRALVLLPGLGRQKMSASARGYAPYEGQRRLGEERPVELYRPELQWPIYGADPQRTQVHRGLKVRPPFTGVWRRKLDSLIEFPPVVWGAVAYVTTMRGWVYALSMEDGSVRWRRKIGTRMAASPAIVPGRGELVVPTMNPGDVQILDLRTGKRKWRYRTGRSEPSPVVRGNLAYVASSLGNVHALDLERRRVRWTFRGGAKITGSPALAGGRLYVGDYAGRVFALNARTGRRLWTGSAGTRVYGTTAVAGGRVFAPSVFSGLSALDARTGRLLWRVPVGVYLYSSPAVFRGRVYFGTYAGLVYSVSASSGRVIWRRPAGGAVSGAVQVVDGLVYAGSFGRRITAWHWRSGREAWRARTGRYVPVSGSGSRLVINTGTSLLAVDGARRR